jgi:peptidoglycan hydrolase-like protein with peptidoglycan-binding domain
MKTKTIESLQQWPTEKGFNPGPIDGENGPKTFKA